MNLLSDILVYIRRILKLPSNASVSDQLLIDYVNRFWLMDINARMELFDFKTTYQFTTVPGRDKYNMPLYQGQIQPGNQLITPFPVYQGFTGPAYVNGVEISFLTNQREFYRYWPPIIQRVPQAAIGNGTQGPYVFQVPILTSNPPQNPPYQGLIRGHVDITGIVAIGPPGVATDPPVNLAPTPVPVTSVDPGIIITAFNSNQAQETIIDSGQFYSTNENLGMLISQGNPPYGNALLPGGYSPTQNVVDYLSGEMSVTFPNAIPAGNDINIQVQYYNSGLPRSVLFFNNTLIFRGVPDQAYSVAIDAYLTPAAFLSSSESLVFGYMSEYIARGAARKYLSDVGDIDQFNFYEPLFKEQELLVWKRSSRQKTATRVPTIYSQGMGNVGWNNWTGGNF